MIITAQKSDKKQIHQFYKSQNYPARFMGLDTCYFIKESKKIIASVLISKINENNQQYFLHALVVDSNYMKQSLASTLLEHAKNLHQPLVCFAKHELTNFYIKNNFTKLAIEQAEQKLSSELFGRFNIYSKKQSGLTIFTYSATKCAIELWQ